ncbi:MAG: hypothetical protein M3Q64_00030 [bacterium]|nr:hypothetical protein [bacterium]
MAEICKDIDQGLAALNRKIDEQNKRLRNLEREQEKCCKDKNNENDNSSIIKRLSKLEKYIESLEQGLTILLTVLKAIQGVFKGFFK